jgi:GDP-D-glucose phosphorylase
LNRDRTSKRRKAERFYSITPSFDYDKFNFTKIDQREILFERYNATFLINNSPLTKYHILIVPELQACHPQIITEECISLAINIISSCDERGIRIGYNSPGALASVNHLHVHLIYVEHELFLEHVVSVFAIVVAKNENNRKLFVLF